MDPAESLRKQGLFITIDANIGAGKTNACHAIGSAATATRLADPDHRGADPPPQVRPFPPSLLRRPAHRDTTPAAASRCRCSCSASVTNSTGWPSSWPGARRARS
ncbi:MAG: hypothetical protein M0C28_45595 [Candidatus Moduliflexus flocculans]|nr:hypothetical protein [Candidatus Moduliflexus flocculans]